MIGRFNKGVAISPSDSVDFVAQGNSPDRLTTGIYVGGAGVAAVVFPDASVVNFTCVAGQVLDVAARRVNSTNTTATLMVALYSV